VPDRLSHAGNQPTAMRVIPDIAADADPFTDILIGNTVTPPGQPPQYVEIFEGGTSPSAPLIAGMQADVQQATGHAAGFANPTIYSRYGTADYHDIVAHRPVSPAPRQSSSTCRTRTCRMTRCSPLARTSA
jgi:subtilase family serine protease